MCRLQNICISTTTTVSCLVSMAKVTFVLLEAISLYVNVMVGYSFQISFSALCAISQDLDISLRFSLKHCENVLQNALSAIFILKGKLKRLALPTYLVETISLATYLNYIILYTQIVKMLFYYQSRQCCVHSKSSLNAIFMSRKVHVKANLALNVYCTYTLNALGFD